MAYIKIDSKGRITAASKSHHCGKDEIDVSIPDDIGFDKIHEYLFINNKFVHDPKQKHDKPIVPPTHEERIAKLENMLVALLTTLGISLEDGVS